MISTKLNCPQVSRQALKLKQAAEYVGLSTVSIRRLIKRGLIKPNRALRHILIPVSELDRFLKTGGAA
jgi:excisionase family DNA binding protein